MPYQTLPQISSHASLSCLLLSILLTSPLRAGSKPASELSAHFLQQRIALLEAENADLKKKMSRFRLGLEQAIAELNRWRERFPREAGESAAEQAVNKNTAAKAAAAAIGIRTPLETGRRLLSNPHTRVQGRRVEVSGEINNPRREYLRGTLSLELLRDGMPVSELQVPFEVPANGSAAYSQLFELQGYAAGSYSARVGFIY